jgi:hypothetical protein
MTCMLPPPPASMHAQTLKRWLVARKWVYADAKRDLAAHAEWRAKEFPSGRMKDADVQIHLNHKSAYLQVGDAVR